MIGPFRKQRRDPASPPDSLRIEGATREVMENSRNRLIVTGGMFLLAFAVIATRFLDVSLAETADGRQQIRRAQSPALAMSRGDIVDRNGILLATNLPTVNLYADARRVADPIEAATALVGVLPGLSYDEAVKRLSSGKNFVYLQRNLTPRQQYGVNALGIPGLDFERGETRVYPQGRTLSHVLGMTNTDNEGIGGIEKTFNAQLTAATEPLRLSVDLRVQHMMRDALAKAVATFDAAGGAGLVMDARTGEILAMVSLPDFDPHHPPDPNHTTMFNRATLGVYEMGSTFKLFNTAAALDAGTATVDSVYDATNPIEEASFTIHDFHPLHRPLTVAEILVHSSNIGAAKMAIDLGTDAQREFLGKLGLLDAPSIELPEVGHPLVPQPWRPVNTMTIAYGHGISVTPLQVVTAVATLVNGGFNRQATLLKADGGNLLVGKKVMSFETSRKMRHLMRLVVEEGSGRRAEVGGYLVGGKTGSAEKVVAGGYSNKALLSSFVAAFPMSEPRFLVMALLDDPKGNSDTNGQATAGWTAAPVVAQVVEQLAMTMGLAPRFTGWADNALDSSQDGVLQAAARSSGGAGASQ